jgi:hypothetical protein
MRIAADQIIMLMKIQINAYFAQVTPQCFLIKMILTHFVQLNV